MSSIRYSQNASGNGSSTCIIEPAPVLNIERPAKSNEHTLPDSNGIELDGPGLPPPSTAVNSLQKWNSPRINMWRVFATFYSFIMLGLNDAAYGALIPYLEKYYNISYTTVSLVFLSPVIGYGASAMTINMIHMRFGQRGIAFVGPAAHLVAYIVICLHPPYPALVIAFIVAGFGQGVADGAWNAWIGDMANANELLGFLHGFYGLGAALSPLIATTLITKVSWEWYEFYYIMIGSAVIELVACLTTFWSATGAQFRSAHPKPTRSSSEDRRDSRNNNQRPWLLLYFKNNRTIESLNKITWLISFFLLTYVGVEVSIGGWVVTFMLRVRHGTPFASGLTSTGFWAGITVGRIVLGFVTACVFKSEKSALTTYLVAAMGLELLFWLVPQFIVSAVMVAFLGFFLGPVFPAAVVAATKLLPKHLHVSAIGFAAAFGSAGACILPFAVGAIAQAKGVQVLQPIVLSMLVLCLGLWLWLPGLPKVRTM